MNTLEVKHQVQQVRRYLLAQQCFFSLKTAADLNHMPEVPIDDRALSPRASRKRVLEFRLGRAAAAEAMSHLIPRPVSVGKARSGEPLWPNHIVGSITHKRFVAAAVVAAKNHIQSIGIDLEDIKDHVNLEIAQRFSTEKELRWIHALDNRPAALKLKMLFSAKESLYKTIFQWKQEPLGSKTMELTDVPGSNIFQVSFPGDTSITGLPAENLNVHYAFIDNYVFTFVLLN
ncbi:MAG: 4'-phosphopantetheinyl transferase superfamily protein [Candidatus Aminicenantes bacterium]|nr:MAG: 4'-phosphopantetheinyl transferase superfamily protein [Candidatus Aminicenantes bacterium]